MARPKSVKNTDQYSKLGFAKVDEVSSGPQFSREFHKLHDDGVVMRYDDRVQPAFMARDLIHCTLPHKDPGGDVPIWSRTNGRQTLVVQPFIDRTTLKALYPYGTLPRLLLYWIVTEVSRTKSRKLVLGKNLTSFVKELGLNATSGGKRSSMKNVKEQLWRLMRAHISVENAGGARSPRKYENIEITKDGTLWWDCDKDQEELFESYITLGEAFFEMIIAGPVPVDRRALFMLKKSSLALDLYGWIAVKTWQANQKESDSRRPVPWEHLHAQMGGKYTEIRQFRGKVLNALKKIKLAYPKMKVEISEAGILVLPAPTPVPEKSR